MANLVGIRELRLDCKVLERLPLDREGGTEEEAEASSSSKNVLLKTPCEKVEGACFSLAAPSQLENPTVVAISTKALSEIGIRGPNEGTEREAMAELFGGNKLIPGSVPAAHCYCGYQFGYFR